jgi:signal transduction histidine kinase
VPGSGETSPPVEPVDMRMVSLMRLILAVSALVTIYVDPSEPDRLVPVTYTALGLYAAYSALLYVLSARRPELVPVRRAHWVDVAWYLLFISLSSGTSSIFFFFFFFAMLVASFRIGFAEGLAVTLVSGALFSILGFLTAPGGHEFELNRFLLRPVYLLVFGYMFAYWGGAEVTHKRRLAFLKEVNRLSNPRFGIDQTICSIMERLRAFYDADSCIMLMPAPNAGDCFVRRAVRGRPESALRAERVPAEAVRLQTSLPPEQVAVFNSPARWRPLARRYSTYTPDGKEAGGDRRPGDTEAAEALADTLGGSYISIPLRTRDQTPGRFYLVSAGGAFGSSDVDFLRQVAEQVQPVIENIQLLDNLATEAAEQERQRISRDIHDSTIQPYIGLKLALESLRRQTPGDGRLARELDDLIQMAQEGIADLRRYITGLREKGRGTGDVLLTAIRRQAEKFTAFYGIRVEVRADGEVQVNDRLAAEVFQLVREALSNVRRHTEARHAVVTLGCEGGRLHVRIEDYSPPGSPRPAPFVPGSISERASSVGGDTSVAVNDGHTVISVFIPI